MEEDTGPLPLPPLSTFRDPHDHVVKLPWPSRLRNAVLQYLPVVVMGLLAIATGWLVRQTPDSDDTPPPALAPTEHDYEMRHFSVQHYTATGPAQGVVEGDRVRHYPANDQLVIDGVRVRWTDLDGRVVRATAARAVAAGDGSVVRLEGGARVVREPVPGDAAPFEFDSEVMVFDTRAGTVRSERSVRLREGDTRIEAAGLSYDHSSRRTELDGPVRGLVATR